MRTLCQSVTSSVGDSYVRTQLSISSLSYLPRFQAALRCEDPGRHVEQSPPLRSTSAVLPQSLRTRRDRDVEAALSAPSALHMAHAGMSPTARAQPHARSPRRAGVAPATELCARGKTCLGHCVFLLPAPRWDSRLFPAHFYPRFSENTHTHNP